ncbi:hypothetical protein QTP88_019381 [Uroleucon formosanum]
MSAKRKCHFSDDYTKEWSFVKEGRTDEEALCAICNCFLSVTHGGKADIKHHISTANHKKKFAVVSTSSPLSKFMIKQDTQEALLITAAELTTAYKVIPLDKLITFCGDNTNTNFGGLQRQGKCNVFYKIKEDLGKSIEGIGCPAHILHNTISSASGLLSVDIENLLSHSRTRWLSLLPAVEIILKLWMPLKHFFDTEEKVPKIISDFFKSPISEIYFLFLHSNLNLFEKNIKSVEKNKVLVIEIRKILYKTQNTLIERKSTKFIGLQTKMKMQKLKNENPTPETTVLIAKFEEETLLFFNTTSEYLKKWSDSFYKYEVFDWMTLSEIPEWEKIENTILYLNNIGVEILSDNLFEQYIYLKNFLEVKLASEKWKSINLVEEKWIYFFNETKNHERKCQLLKLCEYLFAIPAHNATVERVFSLILAQWTDERNRLLPETMESILQCQINYNITCQEFYQYIKGEKELLKKAKSSEKSAKVEGYFADLKSTDIDKRKPRVRLDKFVVTHLRAIRDDYNGNIIKIRGINNAIKRNHVITDTITDDSKEEDVQINANALHKIENTMDESGKEEAILKFNSEIMELQEKENWKNKAQSPKKRKSFYLNSVLQLSKYLVQNGANSSLYIQRATIPESSGQKFKLMVWTNRIRLPVQHKPSIWEYHTCDTEARQSVKPMIFIPINLGELNKVVTKTLNQHIWFDTIMYQGMDMEYNVEDIPLNINIHKYKYRFVAVIAFIEGVEGSLPHYCKRIHGYWECHDDLSLRVNRCKETRKIKPNTMLFTKQE